MRTTFFIIYLFLCSFCLRGKLKIIYNYTSQSILKRRLLLTITGGDYIVLSSYIQKMTDDNRSHKVMYLKRSIIIQCVGL